MTGVAPCARADRLFARTHVDATDMRKLYDYELSGNCHKIRMLLNMLELDYQRVDIDLSTQAQFDEEFVAINPLHKVPALVDGNTVLRDSVAIMIYLTRTYGKVDWYPDEPAAMADIAQWLSFSVNEVFNGLAMSRAIIIFNRDWDLTKPNEIADTALKQLEWRLSEHDWLALDRFTLADLACYPYAALSHEGKLSVDAFPGVKAWFKRVEALPNYIGMRGLPFPD